MPHTKLCARSSARRECVSPGPVELAWHEVSATDAARHFGNDHDIPALYKMLKSLNATICGTSANEFVFVNGGLNLGALARVVVNACPMKKAPKPKLRFVYFFCDKQERLHCTCGMIMPHIFD